jgi:beta-lactamase superfamily II metal-dependent hydrolase
MPRLARQLLLALALLAPSLAWAEELRVYFFDVGQGDSALIVSPTGKTVLIDGGPPEAAASLRQRLSTLLQGPLDLVILTHPHLDHSGGLQAALSVKGARLFMDSGYTNASPAPQLNALYDYLGAQKIPVKNAKAGRNIDLGGGAQLALLFPGEHFLSGTRSDVNANSVVARLTYGQRHVYFAGDSEEPTEQAVLAEGVDLSSDVYKVAHHGSKHSSTPPILKAIHPSVAVISVGAHNDYGHPTPEAISRLTGIGARVYRTDQDGEVDVSIKGDGAIGVTASRSGGSAPVVASPSGPAPAPAPTPAPAPAEGYVASSRAKVFHKTSCPAAAKLKDENRVTFKTREEAVASGRTPAKDCNP